MSAEQKKWAELASLLGHLAPPAAGDTSWDASVADSPHLRPEDVKRAFLEHELQSHYVTMRDGVRLAVDVSLPGGRREGQRFPVVLIFCRYYRNIVLRWPFSLLTRGLPLDVVTQDLKSALLALGHATVSVDVRGTGASFGQWRALWSPEEQADFGEMVGWAAAQPWSSGQVLLLGVSYGAAAGLFTLAHRHPAVRGAALLYPFWDLYADISCPGGIPHHRFVREWNRIIQALDAGHVWGLSKMMALFFSGVHPVADAPRPKGSRLSWGYWKAWWRHWAAWSRGRALARQAIAGHRSFDAARGVADLRFSDVPDPQSGLLISEGSACAKADSIRAAGVPLMLVAGWLDATATAAVAAFQHCAAAPGSQLILGPWTHGGLTDNSVGHWPVGQRSKFRISAHLMRFFAQCLQQQQQPQQQEGGGGSGKAAPAPGLQNGSRPQSADVEAGASAAAAAAAPQEQEPVHYFAMGPGGGWRSAPAWPPPGIQAAGCTLFLTGEPAAAGEPAWEGRGHLIERAAVTAARWEHVIDASKHPLGQSRFDCMTDLRRPLRYRGLDGCGHLRFTGQPLQQALELAGWATLRLWVETCDGDADLFCYLQSVDSVTGHVAYVTEGCLRVSHRALVSDPAEAGPRRHCQPAGLPLHTFAQADAQPAPPGMPVCCELSLLPTCFRFAKGSCVRLAVGGGDSRHFLSDRPADGSRRLWLHTGPATASCLRLPVAAADS